jgi:hypothetical protein
MCILPVTLPPGSRRGLLHIGRHAPCQYDRVEDHGNPSSCSGVQERAERDEGLLDMGCYEVNLGDTTGTGNTTSVGEMLSVAPDANPLEKT